ncbi:hypothetical protein DFA_08458 [Cavenderia fasciculata]|uniref:Monalysin Pore-forming domain-containing protein n=1 Tax=Cavenderia fasciculata TaxID=261658 RepID=F4Q689_CACFS|nr:uncharacterized protein DFA_08458 [Cavenderia fasciculata]EGG17463.1 hypothetical protein DFA_08458 [Cavenderia fasciculata]|eukprot:XP_004355947.1 hypothetical protein DFA_08458 [Cavenderia fasciculata]
MKSLYSIFVHTKGLWSNNTTHSNSICAPFDLEHCPTVSLESEVDQYLKLKSPIDQLVMILQNSSFDKVIDTEKDKDATFNVKPIAVYNKYLEHITTSRPCKHTVTCFKGFAPGIRWDPKHIIECDSVNEITSKFNYKDDIPDETKIEKTIDLGIGTYTIYQTVIVYGIKVKDPRVYYLNPPVYRDDIFATPTKNAIYEPVNFFGTVVKYFDGKDYAPTLVCYKTLFNFNLFENNDQDQKDLDTCEVISSEYGVDKNLKMKSPIDHFVMIDSKFSLGKKLDDNPDVSYYVKPIAVYNKYIDFVTTQTPCQHKVTYFKGFPPGFGWFPEFIQECDLDNEITNKFNQDDIPKETKIYTTVDIGVGTYTIFQTVIVYGVKVDDQSGDYTQVIPVYRNDVFATLSNMVDSEPFSNSQVVTYLEKKGSSRWQESNK